MALEIATVVTGLVNVMATLCVIIIRVALKVTVSMAYGLGTVAQIGFNTLVRVVIPTVAPMLPGIFASIGSALWHVCYAVGYVGWGILGAIPGALAGVIRALAVVAGYGISASKVRRGTTLLASRALSRARALSRSLARPSYLCTTHVPRYSGSEPLVGLTQGHDPHGPIRCGLAGSVVGWDAVAEADLARPLLLCL